MQAMNDVVTTGVVGNLDADDYDVLGFKEVVWHRIAPDETEAFFDTMDKAFPGVRYVLNTRDVERVLGSGFWRDADTDEAGRKVVDGLAVALLAREQARAVADPSTVGRSARNRFVGLVTDITMDTVMAQVELQCGPFRVVSLMSSEAVRDLGLELGSVAVAVVKSTSVIVETP